MSDPASLPPGFRFHPTDEELILHYLRHQVALLPCPVSIIAEVDIYKFDPWDLPAKAMFGEQEWYFFSPRDRKYPNGVRPNRAAASGYWKATGTDKPIHASQGGEHIGVKKALVFYKGRPPKGRKTNWIMHEFRLAPTQTSNSYKPMKFKDTSMRLDDWVLCRIYKKNNSLQSVPPLVDQEQEDSGSRDIYFSSSQNMEQSGSLRLQKSFSVSDFLEGYPAPPHLFDDLPKMQGSELGLLMVQPSINQLLADNNNNNNSSSSSDDNYKLVQQRLLQEASLASVAASPTKRPRMTEPNYHLEGMNEILHPLKKPNDATVYTTEFSNQFDSIPCNLLNQSFFNQQILLNSHLGLR